MAEPVLSVRNLFVSFKTDDGIVHAVEDVSFDLHAGETLGIVGESGSGKSVTSLAILGLLPDTAAITGEVLFDGQNLLARSEKQLQPIRGNRIAMIFQDALAALNPVQRVGAQISEAIAVHNDVGKDELRRRSIELLDLVGIPQPSERISNYPHEFSGGMRQRAMIAMAIANEPDVLITHDLGVVAGIAERVLVMYAGSQVELGSVDDIFYRPSHPYTRGLLTSMPRVDRRVENERLQGIKGQPPSLIYLPSGCTFHPRCPYADTELCVHAIPDRHVVEGDHTANCHYATTLDEREVHA